MGTGAILKERSFQVSASIRIKIIGGTDIEDAYYDCAVVSERLGGMSVETSFNGVEMFYHNQPLIEWHKEYKIRLYGVAHEEGASK